MACEQTLSCRPCARGAEPNGSGAGPISSMPTSLSQPTLFDLAPQLPHGLVYQPDFLSAAEEARLLAEFRSLPFNEARFQQYTARRRVVRFGEGEYPASYGSSAELANPRRPFPDFLVPLR